MRSNKQTAAQHRTEREKDLAEKLVELQAKSEAEARIEAALPPDFAYHMIHVHSLYGKSASIRLTPSCVGYSDPDERCTLQDITRLLEQFPPVECVKVKDGCTSFRTRESMQDWLDGKPQAHPAGDARHIRDTTEVESVSAVTIKADPGHTTGQQITVTWPTRLPSGDVVNIEADLKPSEHPVRVEVNARRDRSTGTILEVLSCKLIVTKPGFFKDREIKWGTGGREYANNFQLYWDIPDVPYPQWWADTVNSGFRTPEPQPTTKVRRPYEGGAM